MYKTQQTAYDLDCHQILISNGRITLNDSDIQGLSVKQFSDLSDVETKQVLSGVIAESDKFHLAPDLIGQLPTK